MGQFDTGTDDFDEIETGEWPVDYSEPKLDDSIDYGSIVLVVIGACLLLLIFSSCWAYSYSDANEWDQRKRDESKVVRTYERVEKRLAERAVKRVD